jgi:putative transposase
LEISRSTYYYTPVGISDQDQELMRLIDEQYTETPFYGSPRMTAWLRRKGHVVNHKKVERLMRVMGLVAIFPRRKRWRRGPNSRIYPYLLRGLEIDRADQVWCADITYIRLLRGHVYLVAVMDWFSRYVLGWAVSGNLESDFCVGALDWALQTGMPEIFNTDQGSQFTAFKFTSCLEERGIQISMDGRGQWFDNIFVERLWRSVKYEEVYLHEYLTPNDSFLGLSRYFVFYNTERPHQALGYMTPEEVYFNSRRH